MSHLPQKAFVLPLLILLFGCRSAIEPAGEVTVEVYDALGRRVAVLLQGEMAAHQSRAFVFDTAALLSGVYVIRAVGTRFVAMQPVVLAK